MSSTVEPLRISTVETSDRMSSTVEQNTEGVETRNQIT